MNGRLKNGGMLRLLIAFALAGGSLTFASGQQSSGIGIHDRIQGENMVKANSLIGEIAFLQEGTRLGTLQDFLIDHASGQIAYVVLEDGESLSRNFGLEQQSYSIPWKDVNLNKNGSEMSIVVTTSPVKKKTFDQEIWGLDRVLSTAGPMETIEKTVDNMNRETAQEDATRTDHLAVLDVQTELGKE